MMKGERPDLHEEKGGGEEEGREGKKKGKYSSFKAHEEEGRKEGLKIKKEIGKKGRERKIKMT